MSLRPYQEDALRWFGARLDRRGIMAHATSAGKTRTAIEAARLLGAKRILIVCPAMARPTWTREFSKWAQEYQPHSVRFGRNRKTLTKAQRAESEAAYAADVQIVSYKLLKEIDDAPRDLLILDELHALRDPLSQQSKIVRGFLRKYPSLPALGLSATLIPTEVRQLFNPLDTFWPGQWGRKHPTGDVSWEFQSKYCYREENEYGVAYKGSKSPEALVHLAEKLAPFVHRVTDKDVAPFLPPLHAEPLYLDEVRAEADVAVEWVENARMEGATHLVVCAFNRETAWNIARKLDTKYVATGEATAEKRQLVIDEARAASSSILVATSEAIRESISLSFAQRVLIFQWRTSPAQALQLLGRFPRQDATDLTRPTFVQYVVKPGDESRAEMLSERIRDIQAIMAADRKSERLVELFSPKPLDVGMLEIMFSQMMGTVRDNTWETEDE